MKKLSSITKRFTLKSGILLIVYCSLSIFHSAGQIPAIQWQKSLGGTNWDGAFSIQQTTDGGYAVAGYTASNDGDVTGNHGNKDYYVVKLDTAGDIQWQKCLGGTGYDEAYSIQQTFDGGYVVVGYTASNDGDVTGNHGLDDYWVVKLDATGVIQWQKCLGGTNGSEWAFSVQQTSDSAYVVAGWAQSGDGDVTGIHGSSDYWVVKLDAAGTILWQKCLGGTFYDDAYFIQQTVDGGYVVAGRSESNDGDVTGNHGGFDYWVVKLDSAGTIEWQKSLGGSYFDGAQSVQQTTDGGYLVAGWSESNDGDVTGNHGNGDYWVVKLDTAGAIQWQKCLGGTNGDGASSIQQTTDGGYVVAGTTYSYDGDITVNYGYGDYWVVKLDAAGAIQWQKCYGGTDYDNAYSIQQTADGGYVVAGWSESNNGDASGNHGNYDFWVIKLTPDSITGVTDFSFTSSMGCVISPNPISGKTTISFSLSQFQNVSLKIFDVNGRLISTLADKIFDAGENEITWNAADVNGGIYFLRMETKENLLTEKLIVTK